MEVKPKKDATTCQTARIPPAQSTVLEGALVRKLPPAEEPAESAAKERQCVLRHQSEERREYQYRQQPRLFGGGLEQRGPQVNKSFTLRVYLSVTIFPGARCPQNDVRISGNTLVRA